nr:hypothetical protein Iba_chr04dCG10900 [Ipomoea batatas]
MGIPELYAPIASTSTRGQQVTLKWTPSKGLNSSCVILQPKRKTRPREIKEQTNRLAVVSRSCTSELFKPIATCLLSGAHLTLVTGPFSSSIVTSSEVLPSDASHSHYEPPPEECGAWVSLVWPGRIRRKLGQRTDKREMTEIEIESVGDREPPMVNCLDQMSKHQRLLSEMPKDPL